MLPVGALPNRLEGRRPRSQDSALKTVRKGILWTVKAVVMDRTSISRIATARGVAWHTGNTAHLRGGRDLLIGDPVHFDEVRVLGVDEHV